MVDRTTDKGELIYTILGVIGASGLLITGALCPGLLQIVRPIRKRSTYNTVYQVVHRLDDKGWLLAKQIGNEWRVVLSKQGKTELYAYELGLKQLKRPKKWDKKWRLLIFDVPEKYRQQRTRIRTMLRRLGFLRLQDSVWVYPFECQSIVELLRTKYRVRSEALYIRAEYIDQDRWLKKEFNIQ